MLLINREIIAILHGHVVLCGRVIGQWFYSGRIMFVAAVWYDIYKCIVNSEIF